MAIYSSHVNMDLISGTHCSKKGHERQPLISIASPISAPVRRDEYFTRDWLIVGTCLAGAQAQFFAACRGFTLIAAVGNSISLKLRVADCAL